MLQPGIEQIVVTPTAVLVVLKPSEEGGSLSIVLLSKQSGIYLPTCADIRFIGVQEKYPYSSTRNLRYY